jgi:hypothetical protein
MLSLNASVRVAEDADVGEKVVAVELPGLGVVAEALGSIPIFPYEYDYPNRVED